MLVWATLSLMSAAVAVPVPWTVMTPDVATSYSGDKYVCLLDDIMYQSGDSVPAPTPCERCVCEPPRVACAPVKCEKKPGCKALLRSNQCCPEYQCECERDGKLYSNGEKLESPDNPCEVCYCRGGEVVCTLITCYKRDDCQPQEVPGRCCPKYDHCPPLDSSNMKMTTKLSKTNSSDQAGSSPPSDESALDNSLTTILTAVTSSRRLPLPGERRHVTRVPVHAALGVESTWGSNQEVDALTTTTDRETEEATSQIYDYLHDGGDASAEDAIAESSEHSPVQIIQVYDILDLANETDVVENGNSTLDNAVDDVENTTATDRSGVLVLSTMSESENSTFVETDVGDSSEDVGSMESTTEAATTETNSVLATPSLLVTSARPPLTSEPWEDHRPTQMVTDDIQYVTTMTSGADSKSSEATTSSSRLEVKSNESDTQERYSDVSLERSTESETEDNATMAASADSVTEDVRSSDKPSTLFDNSTEISTTNNFNETEGSESESTDSYTQVPTDIITSMESLLGGLTSTSNNDEVVEKGSRNTTDSEGGDVTTEPPAAMTTTIPEEDESVVIAEIEEDPLPVVNLSEDMVNHQMDFVIHHIIVPTESDDFESESEMLRVPVEFTSSTTVSADDNAGVMTGVPEEESITETVAESVDKPHESSTEIDSNQNNVHDANTTMTDTTSKDDSISLDISTPHQEVVTVEVDSTTTLPAVVETNLHEKIVSSNNSTADDDAVNRTMSSEQQIDRMDITADPETEASATETSATSERSDLPDQIDVVFTDENKNTSELQANLKDEVNEATVKAEEVTTKSDNSTSVTLETTEGFDADISTHFDGESVNITQGASEASTSDEKAVTVDESSSPTARSPDTFSEEASSGNITLNEMLLAKTNETIGEEAEITTVNSSIVVSEETTFSQNLTESANTTEDIINSTLEITTEIQNIIEAVEQFESNRSRADSALGAIKENDDADNATEPRVQDTTFLVITDDPTDTTQVLASDDAPDDLSTPEVKRETIFSSFPISKLTQNPKNEELFSQLQREDDEEIGKYDVTMLQNFFKNLYINNDHSEVEVT